MPPNSSLPVDFQALWQHLRPTRQNLEFGGKVALVTGGSRGLGLLLAQRLVDEGCRVAICSRDDLELERARQHLRGDDSDLMTVRCDIGDRADVDKLISAVTKRFGRIDILVNNAGIIQVGPVQDMTLADFENAMQVMYWGMVYPTMAILPQMLSRGEGAIVNITSIGGKISVPHLLPYSSAKFAAVGFSEGLRAELAREGIRVTTVVPGLMRTGSYLNAFFKDREKGEFTWFSLGASLPMISMDAERAAEQIVEATRRGDAEIILSLPAQIAARFHGVAPGLTADLLGVVNRFLPAPGGIGKRRQLGKLVDREMGSRLLDSVTTWGRNAARRFNE